MSDKYVVKTHTIHGSPATITMTPGYTRLRLVESCGGAELHWDGWSAGNSLQGWYKSKTQARKAHAAMEPLKDGTKIALILPGV